MSVEIMPIIFYQIKEQIRKQYIKPNILEVTVKYLTKSNTLLIYIMFLQSTDLNLTDEDILFSITLPSLFPDDAPYVCCLSNFIFPTLYDNRNVLQSIINHNWTYNKYNLPFTPIEEIILHIPSFLKRISQDVNNRTLSLYGSYYLNTVYDINVFNTNEEHVSLYKINQFFNQKKMVAFIILTDINVLLFHPYKKTKLNQCKLVFCGEIRKMGNYSLSNQGNEQTVILKWDKDSDKIGFSFEFSFSSLNLKEFMNIISYKLSMVNSRYDIFEDNEQESEEDIQVMGKSMNANGKIEKFKALIQSKENLYAKNKAHHLLKELSSLYEKMVELLSADENNDFVIYLDKIKTLLGESENNFNEEDQSNRKLFENSKAYLINNANK